MATIAQLYYESHPQNVELYGEEIAWEIAGEHENMMILDSYDME